MFDSVFKNSSNKPFYKLLPQNEISEWSTSQTKISTNSEEMIDIDLSTMEFDSYTVSKYCHKKKVEKSDLQLNMYVM